MQLSRLQLDLALAYSRHINSNELINEIANQKPAFNHIRLGDGEAKILGYPKYVQREVLNTQLEIWFGSRQFSDDEIFSIRKDLLLAIRNCTIVGLPTELRINNGLKGESLSLDSRMCAVLYLTLIDEGIDCTDKLVGASSHFWMQSSKSIKKIILNKRVLFISKSDEIGGKFLSFGLIKGYEQIITPAESWSRKTHASTHYPQIYNDIVEHINNRPINCDMAIIGAGPLGKIYSDLLRRKGISSVDMGSIIDAWTDSIPDKRISLKKNEKFRIDWLK